MKVIKNKSTKKNQSETVRGRHDSLCSLLSSLALLRLLLFRETVLCGSTGVFLCGAISRPICADLCCENAAMHCVETPQGGVTGLLCSTLFIYYLYECRC